MGIAAAAAAAARMMMARQVAIQCKFEPQTNYTHLFRGGDSVCIGTGRRRADLVVGVFVTLNKYLAGRPG